MHGLINRAIERFACDTYGDAFWQSVTQEAELGFSSFEAMLTYETRLTAKVVDALARSLGKSRAEVLEDVGTYLVASTKTAALRRLLRFGGTDFVEFLFSLDDLPARALLAVPELTIPQLELRELDGERFSLIVQSDPTSEKIFVHVMLGLLRAMADDYGALVFLDVASEEDQQDAIEITLLDAAFADARDFELSVSAG